MCSPHYRLVCCIFRCILRSWRYKHAYTHTHLLFRITMYAIWKKIMCYAGDFQMLITLNYMVMSANPLKLIECSVGLSTGDFLSLKIHQTWSLINSEHVINESSMRTIYNFIYITVSLGNKWENSRTRREHMKIFRHSWIKFWNARKPRYTRTFVN